MFDTLTTGRLALRRLAAADAAPMFAYRALPEISRYQNWEPASAEEIAAFIADQARLAPNTPDTWFQLGIELAATGELIGDLGLHFLPGDDRQAEVGITLAPAHHGRGYAAEAWRAALSYLFDDLGKHRVIGSVDPRNRASLALMERVGMRREAHFVESLWFKDDWADDVVFAMLAREWREKGART